jgi:phospholipid/cholesterol/gamma-HCH transport system substrate-binding protein
MRSKVFRVTALVGVAVVALLLVVLKPMGHKLTVKAYFANAGGLRDGASVRVAGVEVGSVRSVRVRPELKEEPVEVLMVVDPPYEVKIPNDSLVSVETAGVLGSTYVEIEAASASGPPIGNHAVLKSRPITQMSTQQFFENLNKVLEKKKNCDCGIQTENTTHSRTSARKSPSDKPTR